MVPAFSLRARLAARTSVEAHKDVPLEAVVSALPTPTLSVWCSILLDYMVHRTVGERERWKRCVRA